MGSLIITASGDGSFVAPASTITFEVFAPCGNVSGNALGKGAPGGGARTKRVVTVTPGETISYHIGAAGEPTWAVNITIVKAPPGGDAATSGTAGGIGGQAADCIGDPGESFSGGNGGNGHATGKGGGGGSSAGSAADGVAGTNATAGAAGVGGIAPAGGGNGGDGGNNAAGANGISPGGAPGGGSSGNPSGATSTGKLIATWVDSVTILTGIVSGILSPVE